MWITLTQFFPYAIAYAIPILITSLGGMYSEKSGVTNIGLEGLMLVGCAASAITIKLTEGALGVNALPLGLVVGSVAGLLFSLLHAVASIHLRVEQILSGMLLNLVAGSITIFFAYTIVGEGSVYIASGIVQKSVPLFSKIPLIGPLFFSQSYWTTWLCLFIWALSWIVLHKTTFGLRLRACGENPSSVASLGINVRLLRYVGVGVSGALAGLGGAVLVVTFSGLFDGTVAGMGFLALAALVFGGRRPLGILGSSLLFGIAIALANNAEGLPFIPLIPLLLRKALPYIVALFALVLVSKRARDPKALGEPF